MEAHRLGLGGAVQCRSLAGRKQGMHAQSGQLHGRANMAPGTTGDSVLDGSSAATSPNATAAYLCVLGRGRCS